MPIIEQEQMLHRTVNSDLSYSPAMTKHYISRIDERMKAEGLLIDSRFPPTNSSAETNHFCRNEKTTELVNELNVEKYFLFVDFSPAYMITIVAEVLDKSIALSVDRNLEIV